MTALEKVQTLLGDDYLLGSCCVYKDTEEGYRITVTGTPDASFRRHFNVYLTKGETEVAQAIGVPQDKLREEVAALCRLAGV